MRKQPATKALSHIASRWVARLFVAFRHPTLLPRTFNRKQIEHELARGRHLIAELIFQGTFLVITVVLLLLCFSFFIANNEYVFQRILLCLGALLYLIVVGAFIYKGREQVAAWLLIALYALTGTLILCLWGINVPIGVLTMGFVIVLAGVMTGTRYIIPVTAGVIILLIGVQLATRFGLLTPDTSSLALPAGFGDVFSYGTIFAVFALISWLSRRQLEITLKQALRAEAALAKEKSMLAVRLEEKTRSLREAQMAEMRQLYRFAELGQLSTVVMHELSNHLNVLTLDMDDIQTQRHHRAEAIARAKDSITYLEGMVGQVRRQLNDTNEYRRFNAVSVIEDAVTTLKSKATKASVALYYSPPSGRKDFPVMGDPLRLSQVLTILITNAIEAYGGPSDGKERRVEIYATVEGSRVKVTVRDFGIGITASKRKSLFTPRRSTKKNGMGMGLFIAKEIIETHFKGTIALDKRTDCTDFVISLPKFKVSRYQKQ